MDRRDDSNSRSSDASMTSDYESDYDERGGGGRRGHSKGGDGVGPDGVKMKMLSEEDETPRDGEEYPSINTVKREFKRMIVHLKDGNNNDREAAEEAATEQQNLLEEIMKNPSPLYKLSRFLDSTGFHFFIYFCIAIVTVVSGLETNKDIASHPAMEPIGLTVSIIFAIECVAKIACSGVEVQTEDGKMHLIKPNPALFFVDFMNCMDFFIVIISFSDYYADFEGGSSLMVLRLLRLARVLKVITVIPELQVILSGVAEGCKSIGWILLLLSAVVYIYSILGVMLFRLNDPRNFRNLGVAINTVLNISTADFLDYFFINYYGCDVYGYTDDDNCQNPSASSLTAPLYFISLVLIVGQIMMSLFIGVITNKMEEAAVNLRETKTERSRLAKAQKSGSIFSSPESAKKAFDQDMYNKIYATLNVISGKDGGNDKLEITETTLADIKNPFKKMQFLVGKLIAHWTFEGFVVCAIAIAGIETGIETSFNVGQQTPKGLHTVGEVVLVIFVLELVLKIFVVIDNPVKFIQGEQGKWNIFDLIVVIFAFVPSKVEGFATVIRLARMLRLLKLIRAVPQLQVIIFSLMQGMASIVYVAILMAVVFYVYGIAGVHLFGENDPFHFNNLASAFLTLFRISMMEDWKPVVDIAISGCAIDAYNQDDGGATYADITGNDSLCTNSKGQGFLAMFYFFTFILFSALVLVSVFVGIIVTGMQDATEQMKVEIERRRRANMTKKYFNLTSEEVTAMNTIFGVLDADGSEELMIGELHEVMEGLQVKISKSFLRKVVDVFANGKDELDEADFLLLVQLCKRAIQVENGAADGEAGGKLMTDDIESMDSNLAREMVEGLSSARSANKRSEEVAAMTKSLSRLTRKMTTIARSTSR